MKSTPLYILSLLLICTIESAAQFKYTAVNINSESGLPQNTIKDLHFDNAGFLWVATENGLLRYDGFVFKTYSSHLDSPLNNRVIRLNCNPDKQLFAIDANGTMAEIKNGEINVIEKGSYRQPLNLFIALGSQLPGSVFRKIGATTNFFNKSNNELQNFIPISDNRFWVLYDRNIDLYKNQQLQHSYPLPTTKTLFVFVIENRLLALDNSSGFLILDLKTSKWRKFENGTGFKNLSLLYLIWEHHHKVPFAVYNNRLYQLSFYEDKLLSQLVIDSLGIHSKVNSVEIDSVTRQYFIGTENEGLFIYRKKVFRTLLSDGQKKPYYGQLALNDNYILTSTGDVIGQGPGKPLNGPIRQFNNYIIHDAKGNLFYASGDTVFKYNPVDKKSRSLFFDKNSILFALHYFNDTLWMISSNGIYYNIKGKNFTSFLFTIKQNDLPYVLEKLDGDRLLFGNCVGLFLYEASAKKIDTVLFYPQRCVRTIWRYNNKIFIGTYGEGWKVWAGNKIYNMPLDIKGYLLYSHCFIRDENNYLWIPTNHGLFKYFLPDIDNYLSGTSPTLFSYYYSKLDGLENTEFNGGCYPCFLKLKNNYYSLPNLSGLVWFKPAEAELSTNVNGIYIDGIELNGKLLEKNEETLVLPGSTNVLRVFVSSPFLGDQNNYPVEYRTFGVDTTWKILNRSISAIRFTTLPAGHYLIQLRKPGGFGQPYLTASLRFKIKPVWYFSPVAIVSEVFLLILLVLLVLRLRLERYRKREIALHDLIDRKVIEIKEANTKLKQNVETLQKYQQELIKRDLTQGRFIKIISHDIIGPLRFLTMITTQIDKQKDILDKQDLIDSLVDIKNTGENLFSLSVDILNWINYQKENINIVYERFDLHQILQEKVQLFDGMAKRKSVQLSYECPNPFFIQNDLNVIKIIVRNLLTNAIKFTHRGNVFISSGIKDKFYYLAVKDTGIGMSEAQVKNLLGSEFVQSTSDTENTKGYGIGFMIIRELVAGTKGTMQIESIKGQGTTITIKWPLQSDLVEHQQPMFETSINTTIGEFEQSS